MSVPLTWMTERCVSTIVFGIHTDAIIFVVMIESCLGIIMFDSQTDVIIFLACMWEKTDELLVTSNL